MRHTAQIYSAKTVEKSVKRALQMCVISAHITYLYSKNRILISKCSATSDPKGPVYLWARREAMEEEIDATSVDLVADMAGWPSVEPSALSPQGEPMIFKKIPSTEQITSVTNSSGD